MHQSTGRAAWAGGRWQAVHLPQKTGGTLKSAGWWLVLRQMHGALALQGRVSQRRGWKKCCLNRHLTKRHPKRMPRQRVHCALKTFEKSLKSLAAITADVHKSIARDWSSFCKKVPTNGYLCAHCGAPLSARCKQRAGVGLVAIPAGTPAVIPLVAHAIHAAAITFAGAAIVLQCDGAGWLGCQAVLLSQTLALGHALCGFLVKLLGHGRRATHGTQAHHPDGFGHIALAQGNGVAHTHFARGFGGRCIDRYTVFADLFHGQAAGFVKTRRPQPFIESHGRNFTHAHIVVDACASRGLNVAGMAPSGFLPAVQMPMNGMMQQPNKLDPAQSGATAQVAALRCMVGQCNPDKRV